MKKLTMKALACCATLLLTSNAALADIQVSLDEPVWNFTLQQAQQKRHGGRVNREEGKFFQDVQPLLNKQDFDAVIAAYQQFSAEQSDVSSTVHEMMGQVYLSDKQNAKAQQHFEAVLAEDGSSATAHRGLSTIFMLSGDYAKAREHVVKSLALGVVDSQIYGQLGFINLQLDNPRSAIGAYQNALMLEPDSNQWSQGLLFALIASDGLPQASSLVSEMISAQPDNARLWLQRGQIAMKSQDDLTAIGSLETAMSLGEKRSENLTTLAKLHVRSGSPQRAVDILDSHAGTLLAEGREGTDIMLSIASWLVASQDWQNLSKLTDAMVKHQASFSADDKAALDVMKANVAIAANNSGKAQDYLVSAIKAAPANGDALLALAGLLRKQKKDERAKMYYLRAEALPEFKERAMLGRAQVAINQDQYGDALQLLREVYKGNPGRSDLLSNIQSLENLLKNAS